jgi:hypothetical protein
MRSAILSNTVKLFDYATKFKILKCAFGGHMNDNILHKGSIDGHNLTKAAYERTGKLLGDIFAKFSLDADLDTIQVEISRIATGLQQEAAPPELSILLVHMTAAIQTRLRRRNAKRLSGK